MPVRLIVASLAVLMLAGCATVPNPFGTPTQAAAPPVVAPGAATSKDPRVASLIAAGVVPLAGSAAGTYIDGEETELRTTLASTGVLITRAGDQIVLTLPAYLTFESDKAALKPALAGTLASIGHVLRKYDRTVVDVYGYSDSQGTDQHNRDLSQRRAVAVATALANQGVDQRRFYIEGRGSEDPVASNATEVGRAQNRRVEIQISPVGGTPA